MLVSRWCNGSMSVSKTVGRGSSPWRDAKFLLGCGVIGNTTDFDSVVSGSIPDTSANQRHIYTMKDTYCAAPFVGVQVDTNGNLQPCCTYEPSESYSYQQFSQWQQQELQPLQQDLLAGRANPACARCWRNEENDFHSYRQHINSLYPIRFQTTQPPRHVTVQFGNYCNLRCLQCNSAQSSSHATEQKQHYEKFSSLQFFRFMEPVSAYYLSEEFVQLLNNWIPSIDTVFLHGGEPLITPGAIEFLKSIPSPENIHVNITTNATKVSADIFDMLGKFKSVDISVSLDGIKQHAEYVRHGCHWQDVDRNIKLLQTLPNLRLDHLNINSVLQHTSFYTMDSLIDFCLETKTTLNVIMLDQPVWFSINGLTVEQRQQFENSLRKKLNDLQEVDDQHLVTPAIHLTLNMLGTANFDPVLRQQFAQHIDLLDSIRNTSFANTFGETII